MLITPRCKDCSIQAPSFEDAHILLPLFRFLQLSCSICGQVPVPLCCMHSRSNPLQHTSSGRPSSFIPWQGELILQPTPDAQDYRPRPSPRIPCNSYPQFLLHSAAFFKVALRRLSYDPNTPPVVVCKPQFFAISAVSHVSVT